MESLLWLGALKLVCLSERNDRLPQLELLLLASECLLFAGDQAGDFILSPAALTLLLRFAVESASRVRLLVLMLRASLILFLLTESPLLLLLLLFSVLIQDVLFERARDLSFGEHLFCLASSLFYLEIDRNWRLGRHARGHLRRAKFALHTLLISQGLRRLL